MPTPFAYKLVFAAMLLAVPAAAGAQEAGQNPKATHPAADDSPKQTSSSPTPSPPAGILSDGTAVPNNQSPPKLNLTDAQRDQIRAAIDKRSTAVDFPLGTAQAAANFHPQIGAGVPTSMEGQTLPTELSEKIPALRRYVYVKMPDSAVLIDLMNRKVAEVVSLP
jgi:Spy/CpxP family protein refolding chaperone